MNPCARCLVSVLVALSLLAAGDPGSQAHALSSPITLADCVANGTDCCNVACKTVISACCVENLCGLPLVDATGLVRGTGVFGGLTAQCSDATAQCASECKATATACKSACCSGLLCRKSCLSSCSATETACVGSCSTQPADGAFADAATVTRSGRVLTVSGPFTCPEGALATVDIRVTESTTGALAIGRARVRCTGSETTFTTNVSATAGTKFSEAGTATACGTARIYERGKSLEALQWCREVLLLPDGAQVTD